MKNNGHFLTVGYQKRKDVQRTPIFGRKPMGRKGIGKLSLFSIANIIEVQTYNGTTKDAFIINVQELKEFISKKENSKQHKSYEPTPIEPTITSKGTYIKLTEIRKNRTLSNISKIRTELARRFDIIGEDFTVKINGTPLSLEGRKYFEYVSKIYTYGELNFDPAKACKKLVYGVEKRNGKIKEGYSISGWIGFVDSPGNLKSDDGDDNVNKIYLFCRGKMGQEDILSSLKNSSHYNQYWVGVINADFFDLDGEDSESDKATISRENFNQESEEYKLLSEFLLSEIKFIGNDWNDIKEDEGVKKAIGVEPAIEDWYKKLGADEKKVAKKVLGISGEPRNTVATKPSMPTARCCSRKVSARKRENGSSVPPWKMSGHRRESDYCFIISTRTTKPARSICTQQPSKDTSLPKKRSGRSIIISTRKL